MKNRDTYLAALLVLLMGATLWIVLRPGPLKSTSEKRSTQETNKKIRQKSSINIPDFRNIEANENQSSNIRRPYITKDKGALSGHVTNSMGGPISDLAVEIITEGIRYAPSYFFSTTKVLTDKNGYYIFKDILPGRYYFFCGTSRALVLINKGEELIKDVQLKGFGKLSGQVLDSSGQEIFPANIYLLGRGTRFVTITNEIGAFTLRGLPSGRYKLWTRADGYASSDAIPIALNDGENKTGIKIILSNGVMLTGHVYDIQHNPIEGINVAATDSLTGLSTQHATTDESGYFEIHGLHKGKNYILYWKKGTYRRMGPTVYLKNGHENNIDLVFSGSGSIKVFVSTDDGGELPKDLFIYLSRITTIQEKKPRYSRYMHLLPEENGVFSASNLEKGNYRLFVYTKDHSYISPAPVNVVISEGQEEDIKFTLKRACSIEGIVQDTEGKPLFSVQVRVKIKLPTGHIFYTMEFTNRKGEFHFMRLQSGTATLSVHTRGYIPYKLDNIRLEEGCRKFFEIPLSQGAKIEGVVYDSNGNPRPGVTVFARFYGDSSLKSIVKDITGRNGNYLLSGLSRGKYEVYAVPYQNRKSFFNAVNKEIYIQAEDRTYRLDFHLK